MSDLDRIAAAVRHVARDSEFFLNPRAWGVVQWTEFWEHIEDNAPGRHNPLEELSSEDYVRKWRNAR